MFTSFNKQNSKSLIKTLNHKVTESKEKKKKRHLQPILHMCFPFDQSKFPLLSPFLLLMRSYCPPR